MRERFIRDVLVILLCQKKKKKKKVFEKQSKFPIFSDNFFLEFKRITRKLCRFIVENKLFSLSKLRKEQCHDNTVEFQWDTVSTKDKQIIHQSPLRLSPKMNVI
jgi:hypothetical protein